jgi:hypothetical protein
MCTVKVLEYTQHIQSTQNVPEIEDTALEVTDMPKEDPLDEEVVFWLSGEEIEDRKTWNAYTG